MTASGRPPILCVVTDRRRASGDPGGASISALVEQAGYAAEAGIDLIHVRERDLDAGALVQLVAAIARAVAGSRTRVVVNDRADVALAAGAHGVHLRGDSLPAARVRALLDRVAATSGPPCGPRLVGRSVHTVAEARAETDADYLVAGTTYATVSKPGREQLLGPGGLRAIVNASAAPVLAIGGVTIDRVAEIADAGAAGIAAIGLFLGEEGGPAVVPLAERVTELHRRFTARR